MNIKGFLEEILKKINNTKIVEYFWTSKKNINGLRHFVLVNESKEKEDVICLMVSVLDSEINLKITYKELINSRNWDKGWLKLPKNQSITEEYNKYKSTYREEEINKIFINDNSLFNIS